MTKNEQQIVLSGYDIVADAYFERFGVSTVRQKWLDRLKVVLPLSGGRVLDLGCGAGVPVAWDLAAAGHSVIGVDGSAEQIARAQKNVPAATFYEADMSNVVFAPSSFDGICAFYSIIHVPSRQQSALIARISTWLRPGGTLIACFGAGPAGDWTGDWLGTTIFFGHAGEDEILRSLADAGLHIREKVVEKQDNEEAFFMWVEASKERADGGRCQDR